MLAPVEPRRKGSAGLDIVPEYNRLAGRLQSGEELTPEELAKLDELHEGMKLLRQQYAEKRPGTLGNVADALARGAFYGPAANLMEAIGNTKQSDRLRSRMEMPDLKKEGGFFSETVPEALGSAVPTLVGLAAAPFTGGSSAALGMMGYYGLQGFGAGKERVREHYESQGLPRDPAKEWLSGVLYAVAEGLPEYYGFKWLQKIGGGGLAKVSEAILKQAGQRNPAATKKFLTVLNRGIAAGALEEGPEEAATEALQNAIDIYVSEVDPDGSIMNGVVEAYAAGAALGPVVGPAAMASAAGSRRMASHKLTKEHGGTFLKDGSAFRVRVTPMVTDGQIRTDRTYYDVTDAEGNIIDSSRNAIDPRLLEGTLYEQGYRRPDFNYIDVGENATPDEIRAEIEKAEASDVPNDRTIFIMRHKDGTIGAVGTDAAREIIGLEPLGATAQTTPDSPTPSPNITDETSGKTHVYDFTPEQREAIIRERDTLARKGRLSEYEAAAYDHYETILAFGNEQQKREADHLIGRIRRERDSAESFAVPDVEAGEVSARDIGVALDQVTRDESLPGADRLRSYVDRLAAIANDVDNREAIVKIDLVDFADKTIADAAARTNVNTPFRLRLPDGTSRQGRGTEALITLAREAKGQTETEVQERPEVEETQTIEAAPEVRQIGQGEMDRTTGESSQTIEDADNNEIISQDSGKLLQEPVSSATPQTADDMEQTQSQGDERPKVVRYYDAFKKNDAPYVIEERLGKSGQTYEKKVYLPEAYTEYMDTSDDTNRRIRWGVELSDGRIVSMESAVKITNPKLYEKLKQKHQNLFSKKAKYDLFQALSKEEQDKIIESIPLEEVRNSIKDVGVHTASVNNWLREQGHFLADILWPSQKKGHRDIDDAVVGRLIRTDEILTRAEKGISKAAADQAFTAKGYGLGGTSLYEREGKYVRVHKGIGYEKILDELGFVPIESTSSIRETESFPTEENRQLSETSAEPEVVGEQQTETPQGIDPLTNSREAAKQGIPWETTRRHAYGVGDLWPEGLTTEYGKWAEEMGFIKKGDVFPVVTVKRNRHPYVTRTRDVQPDGSYDYYGWYPIDNDPGTEIVEGYFKWTGEEFVPVKRRKKDYTPMTPGAKVEYAEESAQTPKPVAKTEVVGDEPLAFALAKGKKPKEKKELTPHDILFKAFHAIGAEKNGAKGWPKARPNIISNATGGKKTSSKDLTTDELRQILQDWGADPDAIIAAGGISNQRKAEAAKEPKAEAPKQEAPKAEKPGMTTNKVALALLNTLVKSPAGTQIRIVQSESNLPQNLRDELNKRKGNRKNVYASGVHDPSTGLIYFVADNLTLDPSSGRYQNVFEVALEELVGHKGVKAIMGAKALPLYNKLWKRYGNTKEVQDLIDTYGYDPTTREGRQSLMDEFIAHRARDGREASALDHFISAFRTALMEFGVPINYSKRDIRVIISKANSKAFSAANAAGVPSFALVAEQFEPEKILTINDEQFHPEMFTFNTRERLYEVLGFFKDYAEGNVTEPEKEWQRYKQQLLSAVVSDFDLIRKNLGPVMRDADMTHLMSLKDRRAGMPAMDEMAAVQAADMYNSLDNLIGEPANLIRLRTAVQEATLDDLSEGKGFVNFSLSSDNFKQWFGDSKVVDAQGNPLVVYHGSPDARFVDESGVFQTRRERLLGAEDDERAFFFTDSKRTASTYADVRRAFDYQNAVPGVVDAYLSLQNPKILDWGGLGWRDGAKGGTRQAVADARSEGYDGIIIRNVKDDYDNNNRSKAATVFVAFDPTQIKSASRNSGEFNPNNPDIRFSLSEEPVFHTDLLATIEEKGTGTATVRGWKDVLNKWANPSELPAVLEWLDAQEGKVQKSDLLEFIRSQERFDPNAPYEYDAQPREEDAASAMLGWALFSDDTKKEAASKLDNLLRKMRESPLNFMRQGIFTGSVKRIRLAAERMESTNPEAASMLRRIADNLFLRAGVSGKEVAFGKTLDQAKRMESRPFLEKLDQIVNLVGRSKSKSVLADVPGVRRILGEQLDPEKTLREEVTKALRRGDMSVEGAEQLRSLLDDMFEYMKTGGIDIQYAERNEDGKIKRGTRKISDADRIENYFPRIYKISKIRTDQEGFIAAVTEGFIDKGLDAGEAAVLARHVAHTILTNDRKGLDDFLKTSKESRDLIDIGPKAMPWFLKPRFLRIEDRFIEDYLENDFAVVMTQYIMRGVAFTEFEKRFPNQGEDAIRELRRLEGNGLYNSDIILVEDVFKAFRGVYEIDKRQELNTYANFLHDVIAVTSLQLAGIASISEFGSIILRNGWKNGILGMAQGISDGVKAKMTGQDSESRLLAQEIGVALKASIEQLLQENLYGFDRPMGKAMNLFYKATLLEPITMIQRHMATAAARARIKTILASSKLEGEYLRDADHLNLPKSAEERSAMLSFLRELEGTVGETREALKENPMYDQYATAVERLVMETIVQGGAGSKPLYMSSRDPVKRLMGQLNSFLYAFTEGPLAFVITEATAGKRISTHVERRLVGGKWEERDLAVLFRILPTLLLQIVAATIRGAVKNTGTEGFDEDQSLAGTLFETFHRAGFTGPAGRVIEAGQASDYGIDAVLYFLGPGAIRLSELYSATYDLMRGKEGGMVRLLSRSVPGGQIRAVRETAAKGIAPIMDTLSKPGEIIFDE